MKFVRDLERITRKDRSVAGGKAASLGEMMRAGFPVPRGFVILSGAFERILKEDGLHAKVRSALDSIRYDNTRSVENGSRKLQTLVLKAKLPDDIADEIREAFGTLGAKRVAVRSSAAEEDSAEAAWAGQLYTYLNTTEKDLLMNVRKVWASLFSPRALVYRFEKSARKQEMSVAVVVQTMVDSKVSGVAFSVHPVTQEQGQLVIEAGHGLGEAVVSGRTTPDRYVVRKKPRRIIEKDVRAKRQVLSDGQILELAEFVLKIESYFGSPQDIEWALAKNAFSILQSRPITTLKNNNESTRATKRTRWIDLGQRDTTLLEASIKIRAWSDTLSQLTGRGYKNYSIDSTGNYATTEKDEDEVLCTAQRMPRDASFTEKTTSIEEGIRRGLVEHQAPGVLLDLLVLQFGHFLFDRMQADLFFADPATPNDTKEKIIAWRNDASIFASHDAVVGVIAKQCRMKREDVTLCSVDELRMLLAGTPLDVAELIRERKKGWTCLLQEGEFVIAAQSNIFTADASGDRTEIQGSVAYGVGTLTGVVGQDILVAPMTTPEDVPLIKKYKAVITDQGGILSHAAITCRELHIPCIIGTQTATKILKAGDLIEVDANTGLIKILERK